MRELHVDIIGWMFFQHLALSHSSQWINDKDDLGSFHL